MSNAQNRRIPLLKQNPHIGGKPVTGGTPSDDDLLTYDSSTGKWVFETADEAGLVDKASAQTISGSKTFSASIILGGSAVITGDANDGAILLYGGTTGNGANLELYGGTHATVPGWAVIDTSELHLRDEAGANELLDADVDNGEFYIKNGATFRVYDSTNVDYFQLSHTGSNASISTNAGSIQMSPQSGSSVDVLSGAELWLRDSGNVDRMELSHNGTNGVIELPSGDGGFNLKTVKDQAFTVDCNGGATFPSLNTGSGTNAEHVGGITSATNDDQVAWQVYVADGTQYGRMCMYVDDATNYLGHSWTYSAGFSGYRLIRAGTTQMEFDNSSLPYFPQHTTTASAANAFLNSSTGRLDRSTSSARYKTNIRPVEREAWKAVLGLEAIKYNSLGSGDNPDWSFYGLTAEEVAAVDPRLVHWGPKEARKFKDETRYDENGEPYIHAVELPRDDTIVPDGVMYDRLAVMLLEVCKDQERRLEILERKP